MDTSNNDGMRGRPDGDLSGVRGLLAHAFKPSSWTLEHATFLWKDLCRIAGRRRMWVEARAAWTRSRALSGGSIVDDLRLAFAQMYAAWMAVAIRRMADNDSRVVSLRRLIGAARAVADSKEERRRWDVFLESLGEIARDATSFVNKHVVHNSRDRSEVSLTWGDLDRAVRKLLVLANRVLKALAWPAIGAGTRQYNYEAGLRHPWMAPAWREATWPHGVVERIGEHFPLVDRLRVDDYDRLRAGCAEVLSSLRSDLHRMDAPGSPIREVLREHGLPDSDAAVQYIKDELAGKGLDWRHDME